MPLKLQVGYCKKIGQPDFGSVGANCNVEIELDYSLLHEDQDALHRHVRDAFGQCRQAVENELASGRQRLVADSNSGIGNGYTAESQHNGKEHSRSPEHSNGVVPTSQSSTGRAATVSQIRAIHAIARKQRLDLVAELTQRYKLQSADQLSLRQASELIDAIKP